MTVITHENIDVYLTESKDYRAYVIGSPHIAAWGNTRSAAIRNLISLFVVYKIAFDFGDAPTRFMN